MPSSATAKTKSAPRPARLFHFCLLAGATTLLLIFVVLAPGYPMTSLRVGPQSFNLQIAGNDTAREKGLSGRSSLAENDGMLFSYPDSAVRCFWMRGMRFGLDIIWLNAGQRVVHIQPNATPSTYPRQFCPSQPARYVIELNAGVAQSAGIRDGQTLRF